jgi:hypothetical protein
MIDSVTSRDPRRRRSQIGSELPLFGPMWLLFDRLLAATRFAPPRLYRILWGQQAADDVQSAAADPLRPTRTD